MKKKCLFFGLLLLSGAVVTAQSVDSSAVSTTAASSILDTVAFWFGLAFTVYEAIALRIPTVRNWSTLAIVHKSYSQQPKFMYYG